MPFNPSYPFNPYGIPISPNQPYIPPMNQPPPMVTGNLPFTSTPTSLPLTTAPSSPPFATTSISLPFTTASSSPPFVTTPTSLYSITIPQDSYVQPKTSSSENISDPPETTSNQQTPITPNSMFMYYLGSFQNYR